MSQTGTGYRPVDKDYFERRGLRRYAGVASLWALGVGAVISGHFSGWNGGLPPSASGAAAFLITLRSCNWNMMPASGTIPPSPA